MSPVRIFRRYRGLKNFTLRTLLDTACDLIPSLIGAQSRYKVTELPTERTLRYYMGCGLMDRPSGKRGTRSLFTYRHLLQILAVKHLQSQYIPLRRIRTLLRDASNRELENILPGGNPELARASRPAGHSPPPVGKKAEGKDTEIGTVHHGTWTRFEIAEGVELHIRGRSGRSESAEIVEACRDAVGRLGEKPRPSDGSSSGDRSR